MATLFPAQVAALQVGSYFVGQYYILVQQEPNMVHRFYSDASTMTRFDGVRADSAAGMMQIHNLIMRFNYTGVEIKSAHSVESWNGGILVMVSGAVQTKDSISMRKFAQTFFLAPQEKGYFVLNDIFQFIDDDQVHQHPTTILTQTNYESTMVALNPIAQPGVPEYLREENQTINYSSSVPMEQTETVDKYSIPDPPQKVLESSSPTEVVMEPPLTAEEPVGEPAKHTYASILQKAKAQSGQSAPQNAPLNKTSKESSEWQFAQQAYQQSPSTSNIRPEKSSVESVEESATLEDEGEPKSVYVGNLSSSTTTAELEKEFRNFGKLRPEGVVIRSRKETGAYYAFVEFEDSTGVINAIKASPVLVGSRLLHVEGRRPNTNSYRGGRRGRGRGGFGSDIPRGRYGNRTYGRGNGGYENNTRDYSSRPRGKEYHQRNQERGILGNHNQWIGQDQNE